MADKSKTKMQRSEGNRAVVWEVVFCWQ